LQSCRYDDGACSYTVQCATQVVSGSCP
jgi:hypothetical protein